jgi:hypothetical protein
MDEIQSKYKKRKNIYFALGVSLFAIIIALTSFTPTGAHKIAPWEAVMIACLVVNIIAIFRVFRCPKCNGALVPAYSSSWGKLHFCPKCGVKLTGN